MEQMGENIQEYQQVLLIQQVQQQQQKIQHTMLTIKEVGQLVIQKMQQV